MRFFLYEVTLLAFICFATAGCKSRNDSSSLLNSQVQPNSSLLGELAAAKDYTFNVMAPLTLPKNTEEWDSLASRLVRIRELGAFAVSTDIWWGLVEAERDNKFDWSQYLRLAEVVSAAGLRWVPILSFHQCGGNVGDDCSIPLPSWLWNKFPEARTVSEFGNSSSENISVWSTKQLLPQYVEFMRSFSKAFASYSKNIVEINISFGPAGELRYPSYNSHDNGKTGYPTRGGFQGNSKEARESFRTFVIKKYGDLNTINTAWNTKILNMDQINVPSDPGLFYRTNAWKSAYGGDLYQWYHESLLEHGRLLGEAAIDELSSPSSSMRGIHLGGKVPGIHWRMKSDRLAELNAGLILVGSGAQPSSNDYKSIVGLFSSLDQEAKRKNSRFILHFTCLEMGDNENGNEAASLAKTLVEIVGEAATKAGVIIKGENALSGTLTNQNAWDNMKSHIFSGPYKGLTILRLDNILQSEVAARNFKEIVQQAGQ